MCTCVFVCMCVVFSVAILKKKKTFVCSWLWVVCYVCVCVFISTCGFSVAISKKEKKKGMCVCVRGCELWVCVFICTCVYFCVNVRCVFCGHIKKKRNIFESVCVFAVVSCVHAYVFACNYEIFLTYNTFPVQKERKKKEKKHRKGEKETNKIPRNTLAILRASSSSFNVNSLTDKMDEI